jgi:hypothetical protein
LTPYEVDAVIAGVIIVCSVIALVGIVIQRRK